MSHHHTPHVMKVINIKSINNLHPNTNTPKQSESNHHDHHTKIKNENNKNNHESIDSNKQTNEKCEYQLDPPML
jgi:hypothetical protein